MPFLTFLHRAANGESLSEEDAAGAMSAVLAGEATTARIAAFLVALKMKGETVEEITGFARAMRAHATPIDPGPDTGPLVDTCGTGGDGIGTFNVSTAVALVVAGAGVRVAKHGNRSISSQCGSADVLEELGVNVMAPPETAARALREVGIGFLFAPLIHPAMKHAQPARVELKMRTAFNLLGPLTNPAGARLQLVGAPGVAQAELMARALARLGLVRGMVVHGLDGVDEITTTGPTAAFEIVAGEVRQGQLTPEMFGVPRAAADDLKGGDRAANAAIIRAVLAGARGPHRDVVLANAAAALVIAGCARDYHEGMAAAAASVDSGAAARKLEALRALTAER